MANKIEYGLRKFVVFPLIEGTNGAITYGGPVSLPGIQSMTMDPQGDETSIYADDTLYFSHYSSTGYKGSIQFVTKSDLIGKTRKSTTPLRKSKNTRRRSTMCATTASLTSYRRKSSFRRSRLSFARSTSTNMHV